MIIVIWCFYFLLLTWLLIIKFVDKCAKAYNIKLVSLNSIDYYLAHRMNHDQACICWQSIKNKLSRSRNTCIWTLERVTARTYFHERLISSWFHDLFISCMLEVVSGPQIEDRACTLLLLDRWLDYQPNCLWLISSTDANKPHTWHQQTLSISFRSRALYLLLRCPAGPAFACMGTHSYLQGSY